LPELGDQLIAADDLRPGLLGSFLFEQFALRLGQVAVVDQALRQRLVDRSAYAG